VKPLVRLAASRIQTLAVVDQENNHEVDSMTEDLRARACVR
jgi:hypothetical protein